MTQEEFKHTPVIEQLEKGFCDGIWVKVYSDQTYTDENSQDIEIYHYQRCYLVQPKMVEKSLSSYREDIEKNVKCVYYDNCEEFHSFEKEGYEPLLTVLQFWNLNPATEQIRICEDFIHIFNLYERHNDIEGVSIDFITPAKEEIVIRIRQGEVSILHRYLMTFLTMKKMHLVCHTHSEINVPVNKTDKIPYEWQLTEPEEENIDAPCDSVYNKSIRITGNEFQNWFQGKKIVRFKEKGTYPSAFDSTDEEFIVNYDANSGEYVRERCSTDQYDMKYKLVYFSRDVLDKYRFQPEAKIDPFHVSADGIELRCDNDNPVAVCTFLKDLSDLSEKEQHHWKSYNIWDSTIALSPGYKEFLRGSWNLKLQSIDFIFRENLRTLNVLWKSKYNWILFKPLSGEQKNILLQLLVLTKNDYNIFEDLVRKLNLVLSDSINVKELNKEGLDFEPNGKSIAKLKMLFARDQIDTSLITFLQNLNKLRSFKSNAHRRTSDETDKGLIQALKFINLISPYDYVNASRTLFEKANEAVLTTITGLTNR